MEISQAGLWSNWSGSVKCSPIEVVRPRIIDDLTKMVRECGRAGRHMRVVGSGHSFTPIAQSNDYLQQNLLTPSYANCLCKKKLGNPTHKF